MLDIIEHVYFFRDAFIHGMSESKEGREYLANAKRLEETHPDRARLREKMSSGK